MPTKRKRSAPRSAGDSPPVEKRTITITAAAREEQHAVRVTLRLLQAMQELDTLDKFRLAAIVTWIRGQWGGDSAVLADTEGALRLIDAMTERERRQAIEFAAESNLRAAVTA